MEQIKILPGAEPFFYPGGRTGCMVIHGITGTPFEMRWLGQHLNQNGCTVYGPRLAGHGTTLKDLSHVTWREWYADVLAGYRMLRAHCDRIIPVGLSMGGALALTLASREPVDGVVALSAAFDFPAPPAPVLFLADLFTDTIPKQRDEEAERFTQQVRSEQLRRGEEPIPRPSYDSWSIPALRQMMSMLGELHQTIGQVTAPALLIHSKKDQTVPFETMQKIREGISSEVVRELVLENSSHVVTEDIEYPLVFEAITDFIQSLS